MVRRIHWGLILVTALTLCSGCAWHYEPFTRAEREAFAEYLPQVQFYISHRIVLSRVDAGETRGVAAERHSLRVIHEKRIEKIFIEPRTPGVLQRVEGPTLYVQFEPAPGDAQRALPFTATALYGDGAPPETVVYAFDREQFSYDGQTYQVIYEQEDAPVTLRDSEVYAESPPQSVSYIERKRFPMLLIRPLEIKRRLEESKRKLPGLRVPSS